MEIIEEGSVVSMSIGFTMKKKAGVFIYIYHSKKGYFKKECIKE
jgi:hypothetical protein